MLQVIYPNRAPRTPLGVTKGSHEGPSGGLSMLGKKWPQGWDTNQQNHGGTAPGVPGPSPD